QPKPSSAAANVCSLRDLTILCRQLCVSFKSAACPVVLNQTSDANCVLDVRPIEISPALLTLDETTHTRLTGVKFLQKNGTEQVVEISPTLLGSEAVTSTRLPAMKELLRKIQSVMTNTGRSSSSVPIGSVNFLQSDFFKDRMKEV